MARLSRRVLAGLAGPALGALTVLMVGQTEPARAFPADQIARGQDVWNRVCVECHGPESTNVDAPLLLRPRSLKRYASATAAQQYVMDSMPYEEPGSLTAQEYWDVIAFLLAHDGITNGDVPLGPENGDAIPTVAQ